MERRSPAVGSRETYTGARGHYTVIVYQCGHQWGYYDLPLLTALHGVAGARAHVRWCPLCLNFTPGTNLDC